MPDHLSTSTSSSEPAEGFLFSAREWRGVAESLQLSARELQIIHAVFKDLKEAAIAQRLGISPHTVHTYLERVFRKLGVNSRVQVVVRIVAELRQLEHEEPMEPTPTLLGRPAFHSFELGG